MSDCVFCRKLEAKDYEKNHDGIVMFTPLNPVVPGHKLFVHTEHTKNAAVRPVITGEVFEVAARYAKSQRKPFNLITSTGSEATQTVFHLHVHYVPRSEGDGLKLPWSKENE